MGCSANLMLRPQWVGLLGPLCPPPQDPLTSYFGTFGAVLGVAAVVKERLSGKVTEDAVLCRPFARARHFGGVMSSRRPGGLKPAVRAYHTCPAVLSTGPSQEAWLLAAAALTHFLRSVRPVLSVGGLQSVLPPLPVSVLVIVAFLSQLCLHCSPRLHALCMDPRFPVPCIGLTQGLRKQLDRAQPPSSGGRAAGLISSESGGRCPPAAGSGAHEWTFET